MVTIGLLVFGLVSVTRTVAMARDLRPLLDAVFAQQGLGAYSNLPAAETAGWVVTAVNLIGLVLAIGFAVPRLRARRTAFWIPLAAGGACVLVTTVVIVAAAFADPAYTARFGAG